MPIRDVFRSVHAKLVRLPQRPEWFLAVFVYTCAISLLVAVQDPLSTPKAALWVTQFNIPAITMIALVQIYPTWVFGTVLFGGMVCTIISHAFLYQGVGLVAESFSFPNFADALYFSLVTFTTLGYGDFQPTDGYRLFAASQAVYGYIFLGLLIALISRRR